MAVKICEKLTLRCIVAPGLVCEVQMILGMDAILAMDGVKVAMEGVWFGNEVFVASAEVYGGPQDLRDRGEKFHWEI